MVIMDTTRIGCAVLSARARVAPDPRVTCFDVETTLRGGGEVVLSGTVETERMREEAVAAVETVSDAVTVTDDVRVLEAQTQDCTITVGETPVRTEPAADSERVTSALYGSAVTAFDARDGWRRVRTPDGYLAWADDDAVDPAAPIAADAVLTADVTPFEVQGPLFAGTPCELLRADDETVTVRFRTGARTDLPTDAVTEPDGTVDARRVVENARRYLGTEYEWGGMTTDGIDCSGLVWTSYFQEGVRLPRDTDQQRRLGSEVEQSDLRPGDLLFFPGHVALSLGGDDYIHASGSDGGVRTNSFDPDSAEYAPERDDDFEVAKRLV